MARNLTTTIVLILVLIGLCGLVLFHTYQMNHYEQLVISLQDETADLERSVTRLTNQLQSGELIMSGRQGNATGDETSDLPPVVLAQRRYFSEQEWAGLLADGNLLTPRTEPYHLPETEEGGTLYRAFITDIPGLNPITKNAADVSELQRYINRGLSWRSRDNPNEYNAELAYRIEANEDYTEYHVWLREGIKWHPPAVDLRDPRYAWLRGDHYVTSDDFAFFFEVLLNPAVEAAYLRNYYEDFDRIEIISDHEFIVHWSRVFQGSIDFTVSIEPLPRWLYAYDEDGSPYGEDEFATRFNEHWYNTKAIGAGPYRFVRYEPNRAIELERWDEYYDELPPIESMVFRVISDANTRLNELLASGIDYMDLLPTQYAQAVLQNGQPTFHDGTIEHEVYQGTSYRYLGWNADRPLFADRRVRYAMTHALNRERMVADIFHGLGRVVTGPFFMDGPYYNHDVEALPYDLNEAASLLTQAGWVDTDNDGVRDKVIDGNRLDFDFTMLTYGYRPEFMAAMEIYRNDLARIGVRMHIDGIEWAIMVERMEEKDFDAYTGGWVMGWETDPYQIWHSTQADQPHGSNRVGFRNQEADEIIETARRTFDLDERIRLFHRFHEVVHEEQPYTFFFLTREVGAWRDRLRNVHFAPLRPFDYSVGWFFASAN